MISHASLGVFALDRAIRSCDEILETLGYVHLWTGESGAEYGSQPPDDGAFAIFSAGDCARAGGPGTYLALLPVVAKQVDHFHATATQFGGSDEGRQEFTGSTETTAAPALCEIRSATGSKPSLQ